ncbi:MAG: GTPase HflX [Melioribacteraceae bacterium]|nr:GTPase HflX [Melioribacteraceae bacterium]WKZ69829.1 MAG: GTPase HflX [Melioribacteraceae bacterium]
MIELPKIEREDAILVGLATREVSKEKVQEHLDELEMLADTAGANTIFKIMQDKSKPDSAFYIGKGKAEEIAELAELNKINLIIFDDDLTATQVRNLEKMFEKKIIDRSGLILDIFASHARTREAKVQVELAQLQYTLPRLTRAWTHLSKQYGGIGTKGPGETQIETDRRIIRDRIAKLKDKLDKIESQQRTKSSGREDFIKASMVGYTNAGKSTLINLLTGAGVLAENKLFATLDSTTRSFEIEQDKKILISDTVGFIRKLPHHLVASFKSTLNVVRDADLILHVIDVSHPSFEDHIDVVDDTMKELGTDKKTQIRIFNKVDLITDKTKMDYVLNKFDNAILISAQKGINITKLRDKLLKIYEENFIEHVVELKNHHSKLVSQIHSLAEVVDVKYEDDVIIMKFRANKPTVNKISNLINEVK